MGTLLMINDGLLSIIFIIVFFGLTLLLSKLSKTKSKYRHREDIKKK